MDSIESVINLIAYVCGVNMSSPNFKKSADYKSICIEQIVNCAVGLKGEIEKEQLDRCIKTKIVLPKET